MFQQSFYEDKEWQGEGSNEQTSQFKYDDSTKEEVRKALSGVRKGAGREGHLGVYRGHLGVRERGIFRERERRLN